MVGRTDVKDISGGLYGPRACQNDLEIIWRRNSEVGKHIWGGAIRAPNDSQNKVA